MRSDAASRAFLGHDCKFWRCGPGPYVLDIPQLQHFVAVVVDHFDGDLTAGGQVEGPAFGAVEAAPGGSSILARKARFNLLCWAPKQRATRGHLGEVLVGF